MSSLASQTEIKVGDKVRHVMLGIGEVLAFRGPGPCLRQEVLFELPGGPTMWVRLADLTLLRRYCTGETSEQETQPCAPDPRRHTCTCDLCDMMRDGCRCGWPRWEDRKRGD